jgi:hypothetical protein
VAILDQQLAWGRVVLTLTASLTTSAIACSPFSTHGPTRTSPTSATIGSRLQQANGTTRPILLGPAKAVHV